jgi:hypothetical protein
LGEGFFLPLTEVTLNVAQVQIDGLAGCTAQNPVLSEVSGLPTIVEIPNDGTGSIPTIITGPAVIDTFPTVQFSCTAGAAPGPLAVCSDGVRTTPVSPRDPATETYLKTVAGGLPVSFDCEPGTPQNPNDCVCPSPGVGCIDDVNCPMGAFCIVDSDATEGECSVPLPSALPFDPTGTICSPTDANAGEACTTNADCDAACDT